MLGAVRAALAALALAVAACGSHSKFPPGTKVPCISNADCGSGTHCASDFCRDDSDHTPPALTSSKLTLVPSTSNTLRTVTALGVGTVARFSLAASEPLDHPPEPQTDTTLLSCATPVGDGLAFTFDCALADDMLLYTGAVAVQVKLVDLNLQTATADLPAVVVDTQPPLPPRVDLPGAIVHSRFPWGAGLEDAGVRQHVDFAAGALEPGASARVSLPVSKLQIGSGVATADGSLSIDLLPIDSPQLLVRQVDGAGNNSATVTVNEGRWAASLGGKVLGSTLENPNRLELAPVFTPSAEPLGSAEASLSAPATAVGGYTFTPRRYQSPMSTEAFFVHDTGRASAMLYVGDLGGFNQGGYYEWSGDEWVQLQSGTETGWPQLHAGPCVAYDEGRRHAVLFGGTNGLNNRSGATYVFESGAWQLVTPAHSPPSRNHTTCFYSRALGGVVLVSGLRSSGVVDDAWLFDGDWTQLTLNPRPPARQTAVTVRDVLADRVVMVGGVLLDGGVANDSWLFSDGGWRQLPAPLLLTDGGSGCFDAVHQRFLLKPFTDNTVYALGDAGWAPSELSTTLTVRALVPDPLSGALLAVSNAGTYELLGATRTTVALPNPSQWNGVTTRLAWDPLLNQLRAFVETDAGTLQDWTLSRSGWSLMQTVPFAAELLDVGLDPKNGKWVLTADDGTSHTTQVGSTSGGWPQSSTTWVTGMVNESGELWGTVGFDAGLVRWNGTAWAPVAGADTFTVGDAGAQPYGIGMEDGGALWLSTFGGSFGVQTGHGQLVTLHTPSGVNDAMGVAFDPSAHAPVLYGGRLGGAGAVDMVTVLIPSGSTPLVSQPRVVDARGWGTPAPRMQPKLAFDVARQRTLVYGGNDTRPTRTDDLSDFWELSGPGLEPAALFHVSLAAAKLPANAQVLALSATFFASGLGGVNAWLHTPYGWQPLAATANAPDAGPSTVSFTVSDAQLLDALTLNAGQLDVAVTPAQTNGALGSTVTLYDVEVVLSYRYQ